MSLHVTSPLQLLRLFRLLFTLAQTYVLLLGIAIGLWLWIATMGFRPVVMAIGVAIAFLGFIAWVWQLSRLPQLQTQLAPERSANLLDTVVYNNRINQLNAKFQASAPIESWQQALNWSQSSQTIAAAIADRRPALSSDLLDTLYTVLGLLEQVGQAIQVNQEVETTTYRRLARQKLETSLQRLEVTYQDLQVLRDQLAISSLASEGDSDRLPVNLQMLIQANSAALELSTGE
ncbi:MAG: hypothetical protein AB4050_15720 [Synechococcus sp.]